MLHFVKHFQGLRIHKSKNRYEANIFHEEMIVMKLFEEFFYLIYKKVLVRTGLSNEGYDGF